MIAVEPTVPNRIAPPVTVPLTGTVPPVLDSMMVPANAEPDCCQVKLNVPVNAPLYLPDQVPESAPAVAALVDAAVVAGAEVAALVVGAVTCGADDVVAGFLLLLQLTVSMTTAVTTAPHLKSDAAGRRARRVDGRLIRCPLPVFVPSRTGWPLQVVIASAALGPE